ncbi:methyltransferase domain-containing protein [Kitasatospora sp. GAS1066B]|uniref:methyltransferase domain-containing protein n=1 Tax=Kitasatospora sp. GAS1066B TaxID=3156271 RepID=UPI003516DCCD
MTTRSHDELLVVEPPESRSAVVLAPADVRWPAAGEAAPPFAQRALYRAGDAVLCVAVDEDGRRVAAVSADRRLHLLDGAGGLLWRSEPMAGQPSTALACGGGRVAVGTSLSGERSGSVTVFDQAGGELFHQDYTEAVEHVALSADGRFLELLLRSGRAHRYVWGGRGYQAADRAPAPSDAGARTEWPDGSRGAWAGVTAPAATVCSSSATSDGELVLVGSVDGRVVLGGCRAEEYWSWSGDGEAWSTALSADGATAVVGTGDGSVVVLENRLTCRRLTRLRAAERAFVEGRENALADLLDLCSAFGVLTYGHRYLLDAVHRAPADQARQAEHAVMAVLGDYLVSCPDRGPERQLLGDLLHGRGLHLEAIGHYQRAAADADFTSQALTCASLCFEALDMPMAAQVSRQRIHQRRIERGGLITLYNLAQSYERQGDVVEARSVYQTVAGWNVDYRDTFRRIAALSPLGTDPDQPTTTGGRPPSADGGFPAPRPWAHHDTDADYRTHLLHGGVLVDSVLGKLAATPQPRVPLASYLAYDFSPPADEVKKWLDIIHSLAFVKEAKITGTSLDIGTATARYPRVLKKLGFRSFGVELEYEAVRYARSSRLYSDDDIPLVVGDATRLPFAAASFDLVTCMMGTLSHLTLPLLPRVLSEVNRVLRPGGHFVCSTWDPESRRVDFLTMYTPAQIDLLWQNLRSRTDLCRDVETAGLDVVRVDPFCVFPDSVGYDIGRRADHTFELQRLIDLDLAYQELPDAHGQMFMLAARKPSDTP